ncbi:MAG: hypothetical protein ABIQ36_01135 [Rhodanobacter sp.]
MRKDLDLHVTLNGDLPGHRYLVVNDGDHVHSFDKHPDPHSIRWTLSGNASDGEFCALEGAAPGFQWGTQAPREGIFRQLSRPSARTLSMHNHHVDRTSEGHWPYQLRARFGDQIYQTMWTSANGADTSSNPTIKNT